MKIQKQQQFKDTVILFKVPTNHYVIKHLQGCSIGELQWLKEKALTLKVQNKVELKIPVLVISLLLSRTRERRAVSSYIDRK